MRRARARRRCRIAAAVLAEQHLDRLPLVGPVIRRLVLASFSLHAGRSFWSLDGSDAVAAIAPRPLLLIHGEDDFLIPPVNMDELYDLAGEPKGKWLGPGPHSNIMTTAFDEYQKRVVGFFDTAMEGVAWASTP